MKVKELIEELKKFDGDMPVYIFDWEDRIHCDTLSLKQEVEWFSHYKDWSLLGSRISPTYKEAEEIARENNRHDPTYKNVLTIYADY